MFNFSKKKYLFLIFKVIFILFLEEGGMLQVSKQIIGH